MRQILLAAVVFLVPIPAFAQKAHTFPKQASEQIIVIAQVAELRDEDKVVGTVPRGEDFQVEKTDDDRYQVRWKGKSVWISRADVLPFDRAMEYFTKAIRQHPNAVDYAARSRLRYENGDLDGAFDDCNQVIRLDPTNGNAYRRRSVLWRDKGDDEKSISDFNEAVRLDPKCPWYDKSLAEFNEAIRLDPTNGPAYFARGAIWDVKGDHDKALADYDEAIRLDPKNVFVRINRGTVWRTKGECGNALADFDEAIRLDPLSNEAHQCRAWLRATCPDAKFRDGVKAIEDATKACEWTFWKASGYFDTLAAAYAEAGQFDKAVEWQKKAIELVPEAEKDEFGTRLKLYQAGKPYREGPTKRR